jgi:hypothetical protein
MTEPAIHPDALARSVRAYAAAAVAGHLPVWVALGSIETQVIGYARHMTRMASVRDAEVTANAEGKVTANPSTTSARAARNVEPRTGTQRARILTWIVEHPGATDYQLSVGLGLLDNSVRPRRGELVEAGYVRDSGRVLEHYGSPWTVWEATVEGGAWYLRATGGAA